MAVVQHGFADGEAGCQMELAGPEPGLLAEFTLVAAALFGSGFAGSICRAAGGLQEEFRCKALSRFGPGGPDWAGPSAASAPGLTSSSGTGTRVAICGHIPCRCRWFASLMAGSSIAVTSDELIRAASDRFAALSPAGVNCGNAEDQQIGAVCCRKLLARDDLSLPEYRYRPSRPFGGGGGGDGGSGRRRSSASFQDRERTAAIRPYPTGQKVRPSDCALTPRTAGHRAAHQSSRRLVPTTCPRMHR